MCDSDDDELKFGCLGTPFNIDNDETIENKRVKLKRKAAEEEVTDERGRALRFHGAFTGGFSAGYYNTVGSKEGFKPQQFSSNRKDKVGDKRNFRSIANPEDYMDEEDFSEHGIAPKILQMSKNYDDTMIRSQFKDMLGSNSIFGNEDNLKNMLVPERLTIGIRLLKKLGYCSSKGIGEMTEQSDSENSNINLSDDDDDNNDKEKQIYGNKRYYTGREVNMPEKKPNTKNMTSLNRARKFEYDSEVVFKLTSKLDKFGIGYSGMDRDYFNRHGNGGDFKSNRGRGVNFGYKHKRGIQGVAFEGVDYDGDDDGGYMDPFAKDSMNNYNFEIMEDQEDDRKHPGKNKRGNRNSGPQQNTFGWTAPKFALGNKSESGSIPGFHLSTSASNKTKFINSVHFESLRVPRFYIPLYPGVKADSNSENTTKHTSYHGNKHAASTRVKLMPSNEKDDQNKSVFELMSSEDKQRLNKMVSSTSSSMSDSRSTSRWGSKPLFSKSSDIASIIAGASCLFKSAGKSTESQDIDYDIERSSEHNLDLQENFDVKQRQEAARVGQYGFMTRKAFDWFPDVLVCRRFNVPNPYPGSTITGIPDPSTTGSSNRETKPNDDQLAIENNTNDSKESAANETEKDQEDVLKEEEEETSLIETTVLDITTNQPSIDLFKSVFEASDDDYVDDDDDDDIESHVNPAAINEPNGPVKSNSIVSQLEEALGMTMGDKLDDIRGQKLADSSSHDLETSVNKYTFGPALPPNYSLEEVESTPVSSSVTNHIISRNLPNRATENPSSDSDVIVYKDPSKVSKKKSKKTKKKSKSNKKKKKAHKSSKKKKHHKISSSDSSTDSST